MSENAIPPIIVDENGDIEVYESLSEAALALEAIDVLNGEYTIFDSVGRSIRPAASDAASRVHLSVDTTHAPAPEILSRRLRGFVTAVGLERFDIGSRLEEATLAELVDALSRFSKNSNTIC